MTPSTSSSVTEREQADGNRARATERPSRCMKPKVDSGKPCKREAGSGTDHPGEGPCVLHDDGTWTSLSFAEDVEAQWAFIDAVAADRSKSTRELIEALGYRKRDVARLEASDEDFAERLLEARGLDPESLRAEHRERAKDSEKLFELLLKLRLPEAERLRHTRMDGQLDVRGVPFVDYSKLTREELDDLQRLLEKGSPSQAELPREGRPALELLEGGTT